MLSDKNCIRQVLGCLMQKPQLLNEIDKYMLTYDDFSSRFEKIIFNAIQGLRNQQVEKINPIDVENYLENNASARSVFEAQNGLEYLNDIIEFSELGNFDYYYKKLKKLNLLRDLKKDGFSVSDFYIEDLTDPNSLVTNARFEELSIGDIISQVKRKLATVTSDYCGTEEVQEWTLIDDIDELIESFGQGEGLGLPIQGRILNRVIDGAQRTCLTIRSGASGTGKTRNAVADACLLAFPIRYNTSICEWEQIGSSEKVLFVITEQTDKQIKKMVLAYLSGINEGKFKTGHFTAEEKERLNIAKQLMVEYSDNFKLVRIPNPTIELVKAVIREKCLLNDIGYVFYDYIFIGPALLNEFRGFGVRNDEVLLMMATALKDLAVELDVCMFTSTQVNANADNNQDIRNESSLAGGRSTINKADNGMIMARPTKAELEALQPIIDEIGRPNLVTDIFKVRSGEWTQVRIWSKVDLGIMRREDLFITDSHLDIIDGFFEQEDLVLTNWEDEMYQEIQRKVDELNGL